MKIKDAPVAMILIIGFIALGWVMNLSKLADCDFEEPYKAEVMHLVGLIPAVGAFTGWMDFGE